MAAKFETMGGETVDVPGKRPRYAILDHAKLMRVHGIKKDITCKGCVHLISHEHGRVWYKCEKARVSSSAATDWRVSWQACGLHEPR